MDPRSRLLQALSPRLDQIMTPALVIDLDAVQHNIDAVIQRVAGPETWRPHIKTVKQSAILRMLLASEVRHFKCATADELELLLTTAANAKAAGLEVLVAYPLMGAALLRVLRLAARFPDVRVQLLADHPAHLSELATAMRQGPARCPVFLDVNLGMDRTGVAVSEWTDVTTSGPARTQLTIDGLHGYDGHLPWGARVAAHAGYDDLVGLAKALNAERVVTSGTHSYAHALAHGGLRDGPWHHQVSPGTVVLSDLRSAPAAEDMELRQAAFVLSRIVSHPARGRLTLDAGSKAIAPDRPAPGLECLGHPELVALERSEEHLPAAVNGATTLAPGDLVFLVPEHVCTTVNLYREAVWLRDDTFAGVGPVEAMSRTSWVGSP